MKILLRIPPPLLMFLIGVVMYYTNRHLALYRLLNPPFHSFGGLVAIIGFWINALGFRTLRASGTTIDPINPMRAETLIQTGPFVWSRNPMYLGFLLILVGWGLFLGSLSSILLPSIFFGYISIFQIPREEKALKELFGEVYLTYLEKTPRWLLKI